MGSAVVVLVAWRSLPMDRPLRPALPARVGRPSGRVKRGATRSDLSHLAFVDLGKGREPALTDSRTRTGQRCTRRSARRLAHGTDRCARGVHGRPRSKAPARVCRLDGTGAAGLTLGGARRCGITPAIVQPPGNRPPAPWRSVRCGRSACASRPGWRRRPCRARR